ncbi:MAG: helix-turn-helix domain-containing protein [bacterium]
MRFGSHDAGDGRRRPQAQRQWYSVAEVARMLGMAQMTLYRAIHDGEFPAVKIRGRYVIPAKALDAMEQAAVTTQALVIPADLTPAGDAT